MVKSNQCSAKHRRLLLSKEQETRAEGHLTSERSKASLTDLWMLNG